MAGRVIRVYPKTTLNFDGLGSSTTADVILVRRVDVSQFREIEILVRSHASSWSAPSAATVQILGDGYTDDDPATAFFTASLGSAAIDSAGTLNVASVSSAFGALIALNLHASKGLNGGNLNFSISIDLVGRE